MSHSTATPDPGQPGRRYSRFLKLEDDVLGRTDSPLHTPNSPDHADLDPVSVTVHRDPLFHQFVQSIDYTYPDGRVHTVYPSTFLAAAGL